MLLMLAAGHARAQFTRFANYSDEQGLGNASVSALVQDRDGAILLGTEAGMYRYDGQSITPYDSVVGLPSGAWIRKMMTDAGGRLWVVTSDDVFVRYATRFVKVDIGDHVQPGSPHRIGLAGTSIFLEHGGVLLRASIGAHAVGPFSVFPAPATPDAVADLRSARFIEPETDDTLVTGCGTGLCRFSGRTVTRFGTADGLPADTWQVAVRSSDGTLWTRSLQRIAWQRPGWSSFSSVSLPGGDGHTYDRIPGLLSLVPDLHGGVFTQGEEGLLDWDGTRWLSYLHHDGGLAATPIESLLIDREGSLWAGSLGHGVFRSLGLATWEHWVAEDGLGTDIVWGMTRLNNGQFWVATYGDTVRLDGRTDGIAGGSATIAATRGGRLWTAPLDMPLVRFNPAGGTTDRIAPVGHVITSFIDDSDRLWLCSSKGLYVVPDADAAASDLHADIVMRSPIFQVASDPSGTLWALGRDGLYRRDADGHFVVVVPALLPSGERGGLAFMRNGDIWVSTESGGILRFRMVGDRLEPLSPITTPVLGSNDILFLHRDRRNWMWVGTDHGLDMFDGASWRRFDKVDGLISNDMDQWAVYEDHDGSMWFGTSHGLTHLIHPERLPTNIALHPRITEISIGTVLPNQTSIQADWSSAPLIVRFGDLDFARGNISFRYRLSGLDSGWSDTVSHDVRYAGLPAGDFAFELIAVDPVHGAVSAPIGFKIHIRSPWWRRWWFYALSALAIVTLLAGAWFARESLLLRQQKRLADMVDERTAEIEQAKGELQRLALSDLLTGLPNRRAIMTSLENAVESALRMQTILAVLIIDIDYFKKINDDFGHLAGDTVLAAFGARLSAALLSNEAAGRYGGEEFIVVVLGKDADAILERILSIRAAVADSRYMFGGAGRIVTSSGGVAFLRPSDTAVSLIARADIALYKAKENGRNRIERETSEGMADDGQRSGGWDRLAPDHSEFEAELRTALRTGQFSLHFQPVVDMERDVVTACEALLRWTSPTRGRVSPADFIPRAEACGMMADIGDWVLRTACQEAVGWPADIKIAVNLSPMQFRLPDLAERILATLRETGLPPSRLELEITETAVIEDMASVVAVLERLQSCGISVALDDFGTGYSSLTFIRTLPFDRIKIDRSFVQELGIRPEATAIIRAVSGLAASLNASVTTEGVETDTQIALLREMGCFELQGFGVGRPCPAVELKAWMSAFDASHRAAEPGRLADQGVALGL